METTIKISPVNIKERKKIDIRPGDTVRIWQKIQEKDKTRLQAFEGLVIARKHGTEAGGTFTVRKIASGVGVEKIFPLYSPMIDKIEVIRRSKVRRSKLYYIREKSAKSIRKKMRSLREFVPVMYKEVKESEVSEEKEVDIEVKTGEATSENKAEGSNKEEKKMEEKSEEESKKD